MLHSPTSAARICHMSLEQNTLSQVLCRRAQLNKSYFTTPHTPPPTRHRNSVAISITCRQITFKVAVPPFHRLLARCLLCAGSHPTHVGQQWAGMGGVARIGAPLYSSVTRGPLSRGPARTACRRSGAKGHAAHRTSWTHPG